MRAPRPEAGYETNPGGRSPRRSADGMVKCFICREIGDVTLVFSGSAWWPRRCTGHGSPRFLPGGRNCVSTNNSSVVSRTDSGTGGGIGNRPRSRPNRTKRRDAAAGQGEGAALLSRSGPEDEYHGNGEGGSGG